MIHVQSFLLQASIQILVFSVALLIIAAIVRFALRRRASELIALGMGIVVVLWFAAMLPLPGWLESVLPDANTSVASHMLESQDGSLPEASALEPGPTNDGSTDASAAVAVANPIKTFLGGFVDELTRQQAASRQASESTVATATGSPNFLTLIVVGCVVAIVFGLLRLLTAVFWVFRLKRQAIPIADNRALECLDIVNAQLSCSKAIALLQIEHAGAPFTVGARRPTIFLPVDWPEWSEQQLRANEVAHVQNGDYFKRLLAQFAVALNFYNPLVHWLAQQLVVEQEVSADDLAANAVGGRQSFLKVLAELALEKEYPKSRLVPMFLPTRKTFFRRIEMLRKEKTSPGRSRLSFVVSALLTLAIGIGAIGLRLPSAAVASDGALNGSVPDLLATQEEATLAYVPDDADYYVVVRPAAIYAEIGDVVEEAYSGDSDSKGEWKDSMESWFGFEIEEFDQLTIVGDASDTMAMATTYVVRTKNNLDLLAAEGLAAKMKEEYGVVPAESFRGVPVFEPTAESAKRMSQELGMMGQNLTVAVVDQKTMVICFGEDLKTTRALASLTSNG